MSANYRLVLKAPKHMDGTVRAIVSHQDGRRIGEGQGPTVGAAVKEAGRELELYLAAHASGAALTGRHG